MANGDAPPGDKESALGTCQGDVPLGTELGRRHATASPSPHHREEFKAILAIICVNNTVTVRRPSSTRFDLLDKDDQQSAPKEIHVGVQPDAPAPQPPQLDTPGDPAYLLPQGTQGKEISW